MGKNWKNIFYLWGQTKPTLGYSKNNLKNLDPMSNELQAYRESVNFLADNKIAHSFSNKDVNHAAIVFDAIFKNSNKKIVVYAKNLDGEIFKRENLFQTLINVLDNGIEVIFIVDTKDKINLNFLVCSTLYSNCKILESTKEFKEKLNDTNKKIKYFLLGDAEMYRFEYNNDERKADCNFNDPEKVYNLYNLIETSNVINI